MQKHNINNDDDEYTWPFPELTSHESHLKCPICHELFHAAMTFQPCSHTCKLHLCTAPKFSNQAKVCSLCIRRTLDYRTTCPICNLPVSSSALYNNHLIDKLVSSFVSLRPKLAVALDVKATTVDDSLFLGNIQINENHDEVTATQIPVASTKQRRSRKRKRSEMTKGEETSSVAEVLIDMDHSQTKMIECPSCGDLFVSDQLQSHVNSCIDQNVKRDTQPSSFKPVVTSSASKPMKRIVPPVYSLLSLKNLKDLLRKSGLSDKGDKDVLTWRHKEYVLQYNANLDSLNPKPHEEILSTVRTNEDLMRNPVASKSKRKAKSQQSISSMFGSKAKQIPIPSKQQTTGTSITFKSLIEQVKARSQQPAKNTQPTETITVEQTTATQPPETTSVVEVITPDSHPTDAPDVPKPDVESDAPSSIGSTSEMKEEEPLNTASNEDTEICNTPERKRRKLLINSKKNEQIPLETSTTPESV